MAKKKPTKPKITRKRVQDTEDKPFTLPAAPVHPETDEDAWGEDRLTLKQRLFVRYYVGEAHGNATQAARLAGYKDDNVDSLRHTARETLISPHVQRAVARAFAARFGSAEDVRAGIAEIANGNAADFMKLGEDGKIYFDMDAAADAGALGQIKALDEDVIEVEGSAGKVLKRKVKLYDRLRALELLAKLNGQLIERHRHEGEVKFNPITLDGDKGDGDIDPPALPPSPEPADDEENDDVQP